MDDLCGVSKRFLELIVSAMAVCTVSAASAAPFIEMGAAPIAGALDQPFVQIEIHDRRNSFGPGSGVNNFLLDTGATSIVAVGAAAGDLHRSAGDFDQGRYLEQGIGGFIPYMVSAPYTVSIRGSGNTVSRDDVRILSDPLTDFGEGVDFSGIVGMPAMVDRVTTLDLATGGDLFGGLNDIDLFNLDELIDALTSDSGSVFSTIGVSFSDTLPASTGHRYGIPVRALHFDPTEPGAVPTTAPLPVLSATHYLGDNSISGDKYVLDTGAQLSFLSLDKLRDLGLDPNDPFTTLAVTGVGGIIDVPVFFVDHLGIMTDQGVELVWDDVQVLGLDLHPSVDGVIGSDLLTAGIVQVNFDAIDLDDIFELGQGPISKAHLDFRTLQNDTGTGTGTVYFDLNPAFDVIQAGARDLQPGDANQDLSFDQRDLVQVLQRGKYLTGLAATWGEGDWDGGPGGRPGAPPLGDGVFDQLDVVTSLSNGLYGAGPYGAVQPGGASGDGQTSIRYDAATGEVSVDAPSGTRLTSINIDSASAIFTQDPAENLGGSFDNDADDNIFKATFGSSFASLSFGNVAHAGLEESFLLGDLSVIGSLEGGGELGPVDLIYVEVIPEPSALALALMGAGLSVSLLLRLCGISLSG